MRIAVVGLGFMGATHLKAIQSIPSATLSAVCARAPAALAGDLSGVGGNLADASAKYDFSAVQKFTDPYEAVRAEGIDAVDICLPTSLHAAVTVAALRAGKHVLVEKPIALTEHEAATMIAASRESNRVLMCAQVLRFFPAYAPLIQAVRTGRLGRVAHAFFRRRCAAPDWGAWLADKSASGGGVFDLLIHDIDMMLYLFGKPESVRAWGYEDLAHGVDVITAQFAYAEGPAVTVTGGWHHPKAYPFSMEYTVMGANGAIEYSSAGRDPAWYASDGATQMLELPAHDGYQAEIGYFLECARTNRPPEQCTPQSSADAVRIARLAEQARERKGEAVSCS
jgi:predicted dehydrogenase